MRRRPGPTGALLLVLCASSTAHAQSLGERLDQDRELRVVPVVRFAAGPSVGFAPESHAELAFDATLGASALQGLVGGVAFNGELGFTYESGYGPATMNALNATLGIGYGNVATAVTYQPRLLLGSYGGDLAVGMRNSLVFHLAADLASLEVGHQFVSGTFAAAAGGDALRHDVRVQLGLNPAAFVYGLVALGDAAR